jgi:hypothetical protein
LLTLAHYPKVAERLRHVLPMTRVAFYGTLSGFRFVLGNLVGRDT